MGSVYFVAWAIPLLIFTVALVVALRATAVSIRLLEALGDRWRVSPGLLGFVSAVGANLPNYAAALTASAGGQPLVGQQIIVGSNIYNLSIILGIAAFAVPSGSGIVLHRAEGWDVLKVARLALGMAVTTLLTFLLLVFSPRSALIPAGAMVVAILITLALFVRLAVHAFQRQPNVHDNPSPSQTHGPRIGFTTRAVVWAGGSAALTLALALGSVVIMVQAGQRFGAAIHLPSALLGLIVLAVATSLPNTVVGYQLARAARVTSALEELLSSNCVNLALGSALPLLLWPGTLADTRLLTLDTPLMLALTVLHLLVVRAGRIPRLLGAGFVLVYLAWVGIHLAL